MRTTANSQDLANEIDGLLGRGETLQARALLHRFWMAHPGPATAAWIGARLHQMKMDPPPLPCRLAVLRSFTLEPAIPVLRAAAFLNGIDVSFWMGGFSTYAQEILDFSAPLYREDFTAVILAVETRAIAPELWEEFSDLSAAAQAEAVERVAGEFETWISAFREHSRATLIVHNLEVPPMPCQGVLDGQAADGQAAAIRRVNERIRQAAGRHSAVYVLDYDALVARCGRDYWQDEEKWLTMRMPLRAQNLAPLAREWLRFLHPLTGRIGKVLVTDLDNTLWGGVVGEDGINGIRTGREYPGAAYRNLQRAILDLYRRGVILAVASKNNADEALLALETNPGMLLRPQHFSALWLNWNDKATSLREIARELNVGTESLVFLDDNPAERQNIRLQLPEVTVIELPDNPIGYAAALRACPAFERLALSSEDRERPQYYVQQRMRQELRQGASSLEQFYYSLAQRVRIEPMKPETVGRAAQLLARTNQFNLTTRRYTEAQVARLAETPGWYAYTVQVEDRFGDNGIVGVVIARDVEGGCEIDSLVLSCRVIGRTIESAVLAFLANECRTRGVDRLEGWFLPTRKNAAAESFYPSHGFHLVLEQNGARRWSLTPGEAGPVCPPWIECTVPEGLACEYVHSA